MVARPFREAKRPQGMPGVRGLTPRKPPSFPRKPPSFPRRRESRGADGRPGCLRPNTNVTRGNVRRTKGGHSPLRMWGLCGRSIAGIRLYARNTGKPWSATAIAQPHHTPETYQDTYIDRSTRVADLLNLDTALEPGDIDTLTGYAGTKYGVPPKPPSKPSTSSPKPKPSSSTQTTPANPMSALIAQIRTRNLDPKTPIIFIHSGGQPQTFAFPNQLSTGNPTSKPRVRLAPSSSPSQSEGDAGSEANSQGMPGATGRTTNPLHKAGTFELELNFPARTNQAHCPFNN